MKAQSTLRNGEAAQGNTPWVGAAMERIMQNLSTKQRETLDAIRDYVAENGTSPTRADIAALTGVHVSTVDSRLSTLVQKGWIELKMGKRRFIKLLREDLPVTVAGPIAAGEPILAEGRVTAHLPRALREVFAPQPDYFLEVRGDSLDKLGFRTGTIVAVKAQQTADNGEIVVARIDDQVTLKRLVRLSERYVELRPESTNPVHRPIEIDLATQELAIDGIAVGALIGAAVNGGAIVSVA